jgi:hypothetical protein
MNWCSMKKPTKPQPELSFTQVPELTVALESVNSVIESNRQARQRVRKLTEDSVLLISPWLERA